MTVIFARTSFGPGTLVRFKSRKSHRWEHAIYRGTFHDDTGKLLGYEFSNFPLGPVTLWLAYWPEYMEAAVAKPQAIVFPEEVYQ